MTFTTLIAFAVEESEHGNIALETLGYGLFALVAFIALSLVTLSYRNVANRHSHKAEAYARAHANDVQQAGHGH